MGLLDSMFGRKPKRALGHVDEYQACSHIASVIDGSIQQVGTGLVLAPGACLVWGFMGQKGFSLNAVPPEDGEAFVSLAPLPERRALAALLAPIEGIPPELIAEIYEGIGQRAVDQLAMAAWRAFKLKALKK